MAKNVVKIFVFLLQGTISLVGCFHWRKSYENVGNFALGDFSTMTEHLSLIIRVVNGKIYCRPLQM
jgi:hypothetical protein